MSEITVSERRIRPIQDAIATANWKQALQLCDKWLKKGEKSDKFLATKAFVLVNQPDKSNRERGQAETLQLCRRTPAVTDLDAIDQIQDALSDLSLNQQEGPKVWERAVAAKPMDKELLMTWLHRSIAGSQWLSAQKATMALRKAFPKERQYEFWNILMYFLIHEDKSLLEKDRALFGTLAYRLITKAVEAIPNEKELLSSGKAIFSPEELYLLVQIYNSTSHSAEAVTILQSEALGPESRVGLQDPQLGLSLLLEALEVSQQWPEVFSLCENLLAQKDHQSDDRIWNLLLTAQSNSPELRDRCLSFLDKTTFDPASSRSVLLAKLKFYQNHDNESTWSDTLSRLCGDYYKAYGRKAFCFDDLRLPLLALGRSHHEFFTQTLEAQVSDDLYLLFNLKYEYSFKYGRDSNASDLVTFAAKVLQHIQSSKAESGSHPGSAILAAMALLRASEKLGDKQPILQAILLLETFRTRFEDSYHLSILLLQIYISLGLMSQAMETFANLSIKNMQWETVGHLLLTRMATLHPAQSGHGESTLNPSGALEAGLAVLENADQALIRGIREGLKFGSYANIIENVKVRSDLERSINKQIYFMEERKIGRLLGFADDTILPDRSDVLVDKRDFAFLPYHTDFDLELQTQLRPGPLPKGQWLDSMAICDHLCGYLKHEIVGQTAIAARSFEALRRSLQRHAQYVNKPADGLTAVEISSVQGHCLMAKTVIAIHDEATSQSKSFEESLQELAQLIQDLSTAGTHDAELEKARSSIAGLPIPTWEYLHKTFTLLELLQTSALFVGSLSKNSKTAKGKSRLPKERISELERHIVETVTEIQTHAKDLKNSINAPGVLSSLVDIGFGRSTSNVQEGENLAAEFEKAFDEANIETLCGKMKESWEDALDGILAVKVKIPK